MPKPQALESLLHIFSLSYMSKPSALPPEPYGNFLSCRLNCYTCVQPAVTRLTQ